MPERIERRYGVATAWAMRMGAEIEMETGISTVPPELMLSTAVAIIAAVRGSPSSAFKRTRPGRRSEFSTAAEHWVVILVETFKTTKLKSTSSVKEDIWRFYQIDPRDSAALAEQIPGHTEPYIHSDRLVFRLAAQLSRRSCKTA